LVGELCLSDTLSTLQLMAQNHPTQGLGNLVNDCRVLNSFQPWLNLRCHCYIIYQGISQRRDHIPRPWITSRVARAPSKPPQQRSRAETASTAHSHEGVFALCPL